MRESPLDTNRDEPQALPSARLLAMRRRLFKVLVPLVICYVLLCLSIAGLQRKLTYFPEGPLALTPLQVGLDGEEVVLRTKDDVELAAWWFEHPDPRGSVILCHGNGGNRSYALPLSRAFFDRGFSVLNFDYRGYGGNSGNPSESGLRSDALAALQHVTQVRNFDHKRILVHGHSLGGAVAIALASDAPVHAMIVENAFTSLVDVGSDIYWWLPVSRLVSDKWDNAQRIPSLSIPIFVAHARGDTMIDGKHSQRLAELAGVPLHEFPGEHNSSCLFESDSSALDDFLEEHFPQDSAR